MATKLALLLSVSFDHAELLRVGIVYGCALALMLAGPVLPF